MLLLLRCFGGTPENKPGKGNKDDLRNHCQASMGGADTLGSDSAHRRSSQAVGFNPSNGDVGSSACGADGSKGLFSGHDRHSHGASGGLPGCSLHEKGSSFQHADDAAVIFLGTRGSPRGPDAIALGERSFQPAPATPSRNKKGAFLHSVSLEGKERVVELMTPFGTVEAPSGGGAHTPRLQRASRTTADAGICFQHRTGLSNTRSGTSDLHEAPSACPCGQGGHMSPGNVTISRINSLLYGETSL